MNASMCRRGPIHTGNNGTILAAQIMLRRGQQWPHPGNGHLGTDMGLEIVLVVIAACCRSLQHEGSSAEAGDRQLQDLAQ